MRYIWQDLPERKNLFTVRSASMINLNTGKIIRTYCANTKIAVVQKCVTPKATYYRTLEAAHHYLNYAFEASAFGLPNEVASSAPSKKADSLRTNSASKLVTRTHKPAKKQTSIQKSGASKGEERPQKKSLWRRLFRRKNG